MTYDANCKGCKVIVGCELIESSKRQSSLCPCTECVVKVMCDSSCDDFLNFRLDVLIIKDVTNDV